MSDFWWSNPSYDDHNSDTSRRSIARRDQRCTGSRGLTATAWSCLASHLTGPTSQMRPTTIRKVPFAVPSRWLVSRCAGSSACERRTRPGDRRRRARGRGRSRCPHPPGAPHVGGKGRHWPWSASASRSCPHISTRPTSDTGVPRGSERRCPTATPSVSTQLADDRCPLRTRVRLLAVDSADEPPRLGHESRVGHAADKGAALRN